MMVEKIPEVPFSTFLYITLAEHLFFAIPAIVAIVLLDLIQVEPLFFIILSIAIIAIPVGAAFSWLFAKGSNWTHTSASLIASCSVPARFYAVFLGGLLGFRLFNTIGGIVLAIVLYLCALVTSIPLGKLLIGRFAPEMVSQKG